MPAPRKGFGVVGATADAGRDGIADSPEHTRKALKRAIKRIDQSITDLQDLKMSLQRTLDKVAD